MRRLLSKPQPAHFNRAAWLSRWLSLSSTALPTLLLYVSVAITRSNAPTQSCLCRLLLSAAKRPRRQSNQAQFLRRRSPKVLLASTTIHSNAPSVYTNCLLLERSLPMNLKRLLSIESNVRHFLKLPTAARVSTLQLSLTMLLPHVFTDHMCLLAN